MHRCVGGAVLGLALVAAAAGAVGASGSTRASGENATAGAATQTKRYAYKVQASYSLARDTVDPATSLRVSVERRLEAEFKVWAEVSEGQVSSRTAGDLAVVEGKAFAEARDDRSSPPCEQMAEGTGRIGLKFVTSRTPLTLVSVSWSGDSRTLPRLPCAAPEIEQWETGVRGKGDWTRVYPGFVWYESRAKFLDDLHRKLAAGRNAELVLTFPSPRQQSGVTERAVLRLQFNRWAGAEPKPKRTAPPKGSPPVVLDAPVYQQTRYLTDVYVPISRGPLLRGGEPIAKIDSNARCTGRIIGGPPVEVVAPGLVHANVTAVSVRLWPRLAPIKGKEISLIHCGYYTDSSIGARGKTLRGTVTATVEGRTLTKAFSVPWVER